MVKEPLTGVAGLKRIDGRSTAAPPFFLRISPMHDRYFDIAPQQRIRRIGNITSP